MTNIGDLTINLKFLDNHIRRKYLLFVEDFKKNVLDHMNYIYHEVGNKDFLPEVSRPLYIIDDDAQSDFVRIFGKWVGHPAFKKSDEKDD